MDRKWSLKNLNLIAAYIVMLLQYHIFDLIEHDSPSRFTPWNLHFAQALSRAADLLPAASSGGLELEDFMDALDLAERLGFGIGGGQGSKSSLGFWWCAKLQSFPEKPTNSTSNNLP